LHQLYIEVSSARSQPTMDIFGDLSSLGQSYSEYMFWTALNTLVAYLKLIFFLGFSKRLVSLVNVISRAKISLFFFSVMFLIVFF